MENNLFDLLSKMMNNNSAQNYSENPSNAYYPPEAYSNQKNNEQTASVMGFQNDNMMPLLMQMLAGKGGSGSNIFSSLMNGSGKDFSSLMSMMSNNKKEESSKETPLPDDDILL